MTQSYFVTGTDTEIGKTAISCALLRAAAARGMSTVGLKPVAAGCDDAGQNEDALALMAAMTTDLPYEQVNPVALEAAIAPHIAADEEGRQMQASRLEGLCRGAMLGGQDLVLIEGAGGWRVPINHRETLADLAIALRVPVILVVGMRLGCINHALLTAEAIERDGLVLAGWVANQCGERMNRHEQNLDTLRGLLPAPCLGDVPHLQPFSADEAANYLDISGLISK